MAKAIRSDLIGAGEIEARFKPLLKERKKTRFRRSNLAGMLEAKKMSNQLIRDLTRLEVHISSQASKFPELAQAMVQRDKQDAVAMSAAYAPKEK